MAIFSAGLKCTNSECKNDGREEVQPGWKWSECIKPVKKTESCEAKHIGIVQSGRMKLKHKDGSEL